ncbi:unnamed protein product [Alopecurus aequalis]
MSRRPRSLPPPPLEDDDLLTEILLRLPPQPCTLPRASAVSRRWRDLASDPRFSRRFRARHRRSAPLLGCFVQKSPYTIHFEAAQEPPNRIPPGRFSAPLAHASEIFRPLGCRHGLVLFFLDSSKQLLVWDPVVGDQHRLDIPPGVLRDIEYTAAAVLRPDGDVQRFQVVLVGTSDAQDTQLVASVYSSEAGRWGDLVSTELPSDGWVCTGMPAVMAGDSLYWRLYCDYFLEFDLGRRSLTLVPMPEAQVRTAAEGRDICVLLPQGGGLGFLSVSGFSAQLWERRMDRDGVASWVLARTIALGTLLSIQSGRCPFILGFGENSNAVLLRTSVGVFTVQLESLEFKKICEDQGQRCFYPFECVYVADKAIDGGHDGAEPLQNT